MGKRNKCAKILFPTLVVVGSYPPTDMSIMVMEAARIRSSSADIACLDSNEDKLSKVPRVEMIRKASAEESSSDAQKTSAEKSKKERKTTKICRRVIHTASTQLRNTTSQLTKKRLTREPSSVQVMRSWALDLPSHRQD